MKNTSRTTPKVMFANCGHEKHRKLEDSAKFNFISAGQGKKSGKPPDFFGRQIRNLIVGDIIAVYRNEVGYVGIAQVVSGPMDINNAVLGGKKVTRKTFSTESDMFANYNNGYKEWLVEIKWLTKVHLGNERGSGKLFGSFTNQNVTCSLDNQKDFKKKLQEKFKISFKSILENNIKTIFKNKSDDKNEDDYYFDDSFPEGKEKYKLHKYKERNRKLIKEAKLLHKKNDSKLRCQCCEFSFKEKYGDLGENYIEAHHIFPISKLTKETNTKIEDLALVCSNCHRMLHRKRPWVTMKKLISLLQ